METREHTVARLEARIAELVLKLEEANRTLRAHKAIDEELVAAFEARSKFYLDIGSEAGASVCALLGKAAEMVRTGRVDPSWKVGK